MLRRVQRHRREVSSLVALTAPLLPDEQPHLYSRHIEGSVHSREVVQMLRYLHQKVGRPLTIVLDRLNAHRSREVLNFVARHAEDFRLEFLPPYAPDLNPEEQCNAVVKKVMLNATPSSIQEMRRLTRRAFRQLQHRPETLRAFFRHARLFLHRST